MKDKLLSILKTIKKHLFSIRFITVLVVLIASLVPLVITKGVVKKHFLDRQIKQLETQLFNTGSLLAGDICKNGYFNRQYDNKINAQIEQISYMYSGRVVIVAANYVVVKDTYVDKENKTLVSYEVNQAFHGITTTNYDSRYGIIEITQPIYATDGSSITGVLMFAVPDTSVKESVQYIDKVMTYAIDIVFTIMVLLSLAYAFSVSRPLRKLSESIHGITSGYMDKRLDENKGFGEICLISTEVNKMLERLKTLDDSRQEFVSNVSHELKTPITSIKVLADSLNGQDDVPVELYREFMHDIVEEIDRESQIINDLLLLVRMDKTAAGLNPVTQNVNELVERVLKRLKPIAEEKNIELVLESFRPVVAEIDEVKITQVITNLVENGIKYNVANGWVRVSVNADHKYFYLTVSDSGIGIPDDCRDKIFERFYRVDKARSRQTGGTGLGLAITKTVVLMHKGAIRVYSKEGEGSTFTVRIPLTQAKKS